MLSFSVEKKECVSLQRECTVAALATNPNDEKKDRGTEPGLCGPSTAP